MAQSKAVRAALLVARGGRTRPTARSVDPEQTARAKALGFDTDKVWYHSSLHPLDKFDAHGKFMGRSGTAGIHLTDSPEAASRYLDRYGNYDYKGRPFQKNVIPVYVKAGKVLERNEPFKSPIGLGMPVPDNYVSPVKQMGYDALLRRESINKRGSVVGHVTPGGRDSVDHAELVLHDPSRVRSVFAQYDPDATDGPELSRARGGGVDPYKRAKRVVSTTGRYADGGAALARDNFLKDSKVRHPHTGEPLTMWHGSPTPGFTQFDKSKINPNDPDAHVNGFWFSSDKDAADGHGRFPWGRRNAPDAEVRGFHLAIKNPATPKDAYGVMRDLRKAGKANHPSAVREELQRRGFDGYWHSKAFRPTTEQVAEFERTGRLDLNQSKSRWLQKNTDQYGGVDLYDDAVGGHVTGFGDLNDFLKDQADTVVAFEPHQIKLAEGNNTYDPSSADIRKARGGSIGRYADGGAVDAQQPDLNQQGLYSHAARIAQTALQQQAPPAQVRSTLLNKGVKPDELKWSGFDDKLGTKPVVTRDEVVQHFRSGLPNVQETILGNDAPRGRENEDGWSTTKYHQYQLPGGENYRELLMHLPRKEPSHAEAEASARERFSAAGPWEALRPEQREHYTQRARRAMTVQSDQYKSSHWDEPNVLAHLRMSDRKLPGGGKALHLEELQSDWGQAGRERGFKTGATQRYEDWRNGALERAKQKLAEKNIPEETAQNFMTAMGMGNRQIGHDVLAKFVGEKDHADKLWGEHLEDQSALPGAPYVDSTAKWTDLGLKRALHEAAKGGYDKLLITPGEEQAKRYDLSKQIDALRVQSYPMSPDVVSLSMKPKGSDEWTEGTHNSIPHAELANHIGKDLAERVLKDREAHDYTKGRFSKDYAGVDLKVGGEGMKSYYDKIVPSALQKLARKHDPSAEVKLHAHTMGKPAPSAIAAMGHDPETWEHPSTAVKLHSIDITPKMRASILKGQPAYARGGSVRSGFADGGAPDPTVSRALDLTSLAQPRSPIAQAQSTLRSITTQPTEVGKTSVKSLSDAFDKGISNHVALPPADRITNSKRAADSLGAHIGRLANGRPVPLLTKNAKLLKSETGYGDEAPVQLPDGRGVETTGLALAPAYQEGKFTTCPNSASCKEECLGKTSGNYFKVGGGKDLSAFKGPRLNSLKKTIGMLRDPENFAVRLNDEIEAAKREAAMNGNHLGIRLNVLSDLNPRIHKAIIENHPDVTFYDYTKNNTNPIAPNHHYTYSSTGVSQDGVDNPHSNWKQMRKRLDTGSNVAMAFSDREHLPEMVHDEETGKHYKVVNGDKHDFRPLDIQPQGADGVIVGLKNKKATGTTANAHIDSKGFFVKYDPELQKNANGTYVRGESVGLRKDGKPMLGETMPTNRIVTIKTQRAAPPVKTNDTGGGK